MFPLPLHNAKTVILECIVTPRATVALTAAIRRPDTVQVDVLQAGLATAVISLVRLTTNSVITNCSSKNNPVLNDVDGLERRRL